MKNIAAFKLLVILLGLFFAVLPPLAGETTYTLSAAPVFGFLYGHSRELVYTEPGSDILWSELIWDIKPLFLLGVSLDFSRRYPLEKTGFFADASARFAVPYRTGYMEDRDWLAPEYRLSEYSIHDNYTQGAMLFDLQAGASLPIKSAGLLKLYAGFHYMRFSWIARDGYFQYGRKTPWNPNITKEPWSGPVIAYVQNWFILSPGVSFYIPLHRFFSVTLDLQVSPIVFCLDQDDHIHPAKRVQYKDYMFWGVFFEPRGEFIFSPHNRIDVALSVAYRFIKGPRGYTDITDYSGGESGRLPDAAGAGFSALAAGLSVKIRL
jgi:outer membrane protease